MKTTCDLCGTEIEERYAYSAVIIPDNMQYLYHRFGGQEPRHYGIGKAIVGHLGYFLIPDRGAFATYDQAQAEAAALNNNMGMSDQEACLIILGTMSKGGVSHE